MLIIKKLLQLLLMSTSLVVIGCSSPDNPPGGSTTSQTGTFTSPKVNGLKYTTATKSGFTDSNGTFEYEPGEIVRFYIGNIFVGETYAKNILSPLDLSQDATAAQPTNLQRASSINDNWAINLFNLLLSLDANGDATDGIEITADITALASTGSLQLELPPADFLTNTATVTFTATVSITLNQPADVSTFIASNYSNTSNWGAMVWGTSNWNNQ